jgi:hypothetical protein
LNLANDLGAHYPEINQMIGFPSETKLNLYAVNYFMFSINCNFHADIFRRNKEYTNRTK